MLAMDSQPMQYMPAYCIAMLLEVQTGSQKLYGPHLPGAYIPAFTRYIYVLGTQ